MDLKKISRHKALFEENSQNINENISSSNQTTEKLTKSSESNEPNSLPQIRVIPMSKQEELTGNTEIISVKPSKITKKSPKFCLYCGGTLEPNSTFCPNCGRKLSD